MNIIIEKLDNGGIGIGAPTTEWLSQKIAELKSETEALQAFAKMSIPEGRPFWIMDESIIPTDRIYRDAWELDGSEGDPDGYGELKVTED